jgi:hypothetical protein
MARPPVIISNGRMFTKFKNHADKKKIKIDEDQLKEILYGSLDEGIATLVTLETGSQFVYWKTSDDDDKKFTCLTDGDKNVKGYPVGRVVGEVEINF